MRILAAFLGFLLVLPLWAKPISESQLLQLVDYIGVDYEAAIGPGGVISNASEYDEMLEFSSTVVEAVKALPEGAHKAELLKQAHHLQALVREAAPFKEVRAQSHQLSNALREVLHVRLAPAKAPDPALGKQLYETHCVACHGPTGAGDGPLSINLTPAPTNFQDASRMQHLSLFAIYNTITLGVEGTSMAPYAESLTDEERWSLASYIKGIAKLPEELVSDPFIITLDKLALSMTAYETGDKKGAYQYALAAYLDGFETAEAVLDIVNRDQRLVLEKKMIAFRSAIEAGVPVETLKVDYNELRGMLQEVQASLPTTEFSAPAIFFSSLIILLREGLESILIIGMLIVMLIKGERRDLVPVVHAGWLVALVAGVFTWWGSHTLIGISGAVRELTEGITALVAAAMLLYVGVWIHRNELAHDWRKYLKEKLSQQLTKEARWGLGLLAFLAVYREVFETVLFYEALGLQVGAVGMNMVWLGIGIAAILLLLTVFGMVRFGLKLPVQQFFRVSSWLIFIFAIIFIGQGIHGLEEAGKVPVWPVPVPRIDLLGLYPNLFGLSIQGLILAIALYFGMRDRK